MNAPDHRREFAVEVVRQLRDAGFEALWAGGCVRDQLLGKDPKDYDVATSARPEEVRKVFGHQRTLAIGASFGVISVVGNRQQGHIEIATFRQDAGYSDGRRPDSVTFSSAEEDAKRRDFTINGIFFDPLRDEVIDYVGGQQDLNNKTIRAIGNADDRIAEDKLRMLRGIRFAATYGFDLDPETFDAIRNHADWLSAVSRERIAAEVHRMFSHPQRGLAASYLVESGLYRTVFDSSLLEFENLKESIELIGLLDSTNFATAMAAFLLPLWQHDLQDRKQVQALKTALHDWKYSNEETQAVVWLLKSYPFLLSASDQNWPQVQRKLVDDLGQELFNLAVACSVHHQNRYQESILYCHQKLELPAEQLNPAPLIDGEDLIQAGYSPGPMFKESLDRIRDLQLNGAIDSREEALREVEKFFNDKGQATS